MHREGSKFFRWLVVGVITLVTLNIVWFHWFQPHIAIGSSWGTKLFSASGQLHNFTLAVAHWKDLVKENTDLKNKLQEEIANQASTAQLQRENDQLRNALGLASRTKKSVIPAGIYNVSLAPDGYTALVNKGTNDGVAVGDAVVGEHSILIGTIQSVFSTSSRVTLVSDPSFKVTALVLGGQAKSIAHGALDKGMALDLVVQSDEIKQGDTLVSSGDDMIPAGLVIGIVSQVGSNSAKLFKQVSVSPSAQFITGSVFILK